MKEKLKMVRRHWFLVLLGVLFVSFFFNESFRVTLSRRRAIEKSALEYDRLRLETARLQKQIAALETRPSQMENHVRRELGYLRPGEKEVRFMRKKTT